MSRLQAYAPHHTHAGAQWRSRCAYQRGMTILEVMVVLTLVVLLVALFYTGVRFISGANLREDTTEVAAVLRAAYNMSTSTGKHHRVVFDLDEQTYRIEMCEGDITIRFAEREEALEKGDLDALQEFAQKGAKDILPPEMAQAISPEQAAKAAAAITGTRLGQAMCGEVKLPTGDSDGRGAQRRIRTEEGLKVRSITVQHLEDAQANGIVHINFFPMGRAEKAVVEIGDEDGNTYTLLVHGLTGRVEFRDGHFDADDHMMRRADGERIVERTEER